MEDGSSNVSPSTQKEPISHFSFVIFTGGRGGFRLSGTNILSRTKSRIEREVSPRESGTWRLRWSVLSYRRSHEVQFPSLRCVSLHHYFLTSLSCSRSQLC